MSSQAPMRADARRNYDALVTTARRHLSEQGVSTSLEAIAQEAGVGIATLYRHFPDRDHLVFAALNNHAEQLREASASIKDTGPAQTRLQRWLAEVEAYLSAYQGLPASIANALECGEESPLAMNCYDIVSATDEFVAEARHLGLIKPEVTGRTLFEATLMLAWLGAQLPEGENTDAVRQVLARGYLS